MIFNLMATLLVASSIGAPIYEEASFEVAPTAHCLQTQNNIVTLTADELNGNPFRHFYEWLVEKSHSVYGLIEIDYNDQTYTFSDQTEADGFIWNAGDNNIYLNSPTSTDNNYPPYYFSYNDGVIDNPFVSVIDIQFYLDSQPSEALAEEAYAVMQEDLTPPTITDNIFSTIGETITGMINNLSSALGGVTGLFWNSTENKLTVLGVLSVIAVGAGVVYFVFRLIRGLLSSGARA